MSGQNWLSADVSLAELPALREFGANMRDVWTFRAAYADGRDVERAAVIRYLDALASRDTTWPPGFGAELQKAIVHIGNARHVADE